MVGFGETYIPAFALAVGAGEILSGLVTTLPMMAGGLLQLFSSSASHWARSRRRWVVATAAGQGLAFFILAAGAACAWMPAWLLFAVATLYWATGLATGPAWNSWIDTLIPARLRAGFFARRTRLAQAALVLGIVLGGFALNRFANSDQLLPAFAFIFTAAGVARLLSAAALACQREPILPRSADRPPTLMRSLRDLRSSPVRHLFRFLLAIQASVYISAPFFNAYMLVRLELSYGEYLVVLATAYVAKVVALSFLGGVARRIGVWKLLAIGSVGIVPLPSLWVVSGEIWYLLAVQVLSGIAWAMYELGMFLVLFDAIPAEKRTPYLTLFNAGNVTAIAIGSMGGVLFMNYLDPAWAYPAVFLSSMIGRGLSLLLLHRAGPRRRHVEADRAFRIDQPSVDVHPPRQPTLLVDSVF
jgi:MFS family permease